MTDSFTLLSDLFSKESYDKKSKKSGLVVFLLVLVILLFNIFKKCVSSSDFRSRNENPYILQFYKMISLSLVALLFYFITGFLNWNVYKLFFLGLYVVVENLTSVIKKLGTYSSLIVPHNRRPYDAIDCNIINKGGKYGPSHVLYQSSTMWNDAKDGRPGMPSGHTATITSIFVLYAGNFFYILEKTKKASTTSWILFFILLLLTLLIGISRHYLNCHTPLQICCGYIFGTVCGIVAYYLSRILSKRSKIFKHCLETFYK